MTTPSTRRKLVFDDVFTDLAQRPPRRVAAAWASHLHHAGQAVYGWLDGIP